MRNSRATANVFVVNGGKADMWGLAAGTTYDIKETRPPDDGYDATRGIASYSVMDDHGQLTGGFTVHGDKVDMESQEAFLVVTNSKLQPVRRPPCR